MSIRVSGTDWVEGGWDIEQTVALARALELRGLSRSKLSHHAFGIGKRRWIGESREEIGRHHVDPYVGALGGEDRSHEELKRGLEV